MSASQTVLVTDAGFTPAPAREIVALADLTDQTSVEIGGCSAHLALIRRGRDDFGSTLPLLDGGCLDPVAANFLKEIRITQVACPGRSTGVKLFENSKQHHGNHEPDGNFREPLIIQARLQSQYLQ